MELKKLGSSRFVTFLLVLQEISESQAFGCKTKFMARTLLEKWTKFDTIMTAKVLLDLFEVTSIVSCYLQYKHLDYLKAWAKVNTLLEQVTKKRSDDQFKLLYDNCVAFMEEIRKFLGDKLGLDIESDFPEKRVPIKKKMPGETATDESRNFSPYQRFKTDTFFDIIDRAKKNIEKRFVKNKDLLLDCFWLDPRKYKEIRDLKLTDIPQNVFVKLSELTGISRDSLIRELKDFATHYENYKMTWRELYEHDTIDTDTISEPKSAEKIHLNQNRKSKSRERKILNLMKFVVLRRTV